MNDLCAGILAGLDKEVDDVEDVEGRPREEEHDAHPNQNPARTIVLLIELKLLINILPIFELGFVEKKKKLQMERKASFELHITFRLSKHNLHLITFF